MSDNDSYKGFTDLVESVILENEAKGIQYRFTISSFRDKTYIGIREWYMNFEGDYAPSKNGVTLPYSLHTTSRLYKALHNILSAAEVLDEVKQEVTASEQNITGKSEALE
jgi:hypothetical protein